MYVRSSHSDVHNIVYIFVKTFWFYNTKVRKGVAVWLVNSASELCNVVMKSERGYWVLSLTKLLFFMKLGVLIFVICGYEACKQ